MPPGPGHTIGVSTSWPTTGHPEIDRQHSVLFALVERARRCTIQPQTSCLSVAQRRELHSIVADLAKYIIEHFAYEEHLMAATAYTDTKRHLASHRAIHAHVVQVIEAFNAGQDATSLISTMLDAWLHHHIGSIDQDLAAYLRSGVAANSGGNGAGCSAMG